MRMMKGSSLVIGFAFACLLNATPTIANDKLKVNALTGTWLLAIENLQHRTIVTAAIQFKNEAAESCISGDWKRAVVTSYKTVDDEFFPVGQSLSYELTNQLLVIGRNEVCDSYRHLRGELKGASVKGDYVGFGWGKEHMGYFSLRRNVE